MSTAAGWARRAGEMRAVADDVVPPMTGLDYVEGVAGALPGLALLVCSGPAPIVDRIRGLRGGADDWVTKPCHPDELIARLEAVLRRRRAGEVPVQDETIAAGELAIRPDRFDACVGDVTAGLSRKEYGRCVRAQAATEARACLPGMAPRPHPLRGRLPVCRRADRGRSRRPPGRRAGPDGAAGSKGQPVQTGQPIAVPAGSDRRPREPARAAEPAAAYPVL